MVEVTSRTIGGCFALRPCAESTSLISGVIGRAQFLYPTVRIHATNPLSSHTTDLLSALDPAELSSFVGFVKCNIAKELTALHDLPFGVFDRRRARIIPVASDRRSQEARLRYVLEQGTKEDLVESPRHWPGLTGVHALETGEMPSGLWFDRTAAYNEGLDRETFDNPEFATRYEVKLSPLPCWEGMSVDEQRARATAIVDDISANAAARRKRDRRSVLGADAVMAFAPTFAPGKLERSPAPIVHAASKPVFKALRQVIVHFCEAFWACSRRSRKPKAKPVAFSELLLPARSTDDRR